MASFDVVNYSLRPSKAIQRQLVFDGIQKLKAQLELDNAVYVGFGSIWFTDFILAHKMLRINDMYSIEANDVGYKRAQFNSPFATVRVKHGLSSIVLSELYADESISNRPWVIWLDYDYEFNEALKDDIRSAIENAPPCSIILVTFNGHEMKYGAAGDRPGRLRDLFGSSVPQELTKAECKDARMQETLANFTLDYMQSTANDLARPGGFLRAFRIIYRDNSPMVTVGGILPTRGAVTTARQVIDAVDWPCRPPAPVIAPLLTVREAGALQSKLPSGIPLTRAEVQALGFDLEEEKLEAFTNYYRYYPAFAQIIT
ncbi:O-methyltransferase [Methylocella sp. CPCC 101449]|uniref:O-methyltransferase n=1 Tax=Methylocella sp. CPCC 101449 TaxID=2987531 RepID=UPI00288E2F7F|nr:O-methyltransferase [Methylocella sp. CPCC 101449]MDT2022830.1 hypothetical protein [Methylocella sp. CPCC 101449]